MVTPSSTVFLALCGPWFIGETIFTTGPFTLRSATEGVGRESPDEEKLF